MNKKTGLIIMALVLVISFSACNTKGVVETNPIDNKTGTADDGNKSIIIDADPAVNDETEVNDEVEDKVSEDISADDGNADPVVDEEVNNVVETEPENSETEITLYYANNEYIMTGDESLDIVVPVTRSVILGEKPIEKVVVEELQKQPSDENLDTSLEEINILTVDIAENIAYVNISSENLNGGSLTETLVLQQLVYSLIELDGVNAVQILVDGSKQDSLMGHYGIREPLTRADLQ